MALCVERNPGMNFGASFLSEEYESFLTMQGKDFGEIAKKLLYRLLPLMSAALGLASHGRLIDRVRHHILQKIVTEHVSQRSIRGIPPVGSKRDIHTMGVYVPRQTSGIVTFYPETPEDAVLDNIDLSHSNGEETKAGTYLPLYLDV